ncbi:BrxA/BrxB family bacilliredoxin [Aureibacillus halotolerans]|uniref:Putative YphP/YqiW family bacilliredoxin n=1 Tax=Aureibacillus halotolerans TaxID=1508390 RepID=A0A4R6U718_9BACI|nr:BrxA/BrxB family bacilliredoxin [Aureibacillus halotolerans]TDQ41462.1 putative YphP/YqiW family bacilliredoxin [Aureibacillus halotolerans]
MSSAYEEHMRQLVVPMRRELTSEGFEELTTAENVDQFIETLSDEDTSLVIVNSVCGCAAGLARPAAVHAVKQDGAPNKLVTVFAGQDKEATAKMREYFGEIPPSSPSMAILKGKSVHHFIHRHEIEGAEPQEIYDQLLQAFQTVKNA